MISTVTGVTNGASDLADPVLWIVYVVGFGLTALASMDKPWTWWVTTVAVLFLILVGILYYPTVFVPSTQTAFGWFENAVYVGLLILAEYLCVQRLRNVILTPESCAGDGQAVRGQARS